jgi:hypothetical protein
VAQRKRRRRPKGKPYPRTIPDKAKTRRWYAPRTKGGKSQALRRADGTFIDGDTPTAEAEALAAWERFRTAGETPLQKQSEASEVQLVFEIVWADGQGVPSDAAIDRCREAIRIALDRCLRHLGRVPSSRTITEVIALPPRGRRVKVVATATC